MRFSVKMTAFAATVFTVPLLWAPMDAHALDQSAKQPINQKTEPAKAVAPAPVNVTVQPGDSLSAIADAHSTTWVRIYDANAAITDPNLIHPGEQYRIPDASEQLPDRYGELTAEQVQTMPATYQPSGQANGTPARTASAPRTSSAGNTYYWGQCTWYVKNRRPEIGNMWGNAGYNWLSAARAAGFSTGTAPAVGAIAVEPGHVAIVESVSGSAVSVSEMNWNGGVGVVSYRTTSASEFQYIY